MKNSLRTAAISMVIGTAASVAITAPAFANDDVVKFSYSAEELTTNHGIQNVKDRLTRKAKRNCR